MGTTSSTTMQCLEEIVQCALAVGAKIWCWFFCHAPRPARCSFEGVYFEQVLCHCLWVDFDAVFSIFSEGIALLSDVLDNSYFCC